MIDDIFFTDAVVCCDMMLTAVVAEVFPDGWSKWLLCHLRRVVINLCIVITRYTFHVSQSMHGIAEFT